jgi:hypothetical protein
MQRESGSRNPGDHDCLLGEVYNNIYLCTADETEKSKKTTFAARQSKVGTQNCRKYEGILN